MGAGQGDATCPGQDGEPDGGTLWFEEDINAHLAALNAGTLGSDGVTFVRQVDRNGHGTHVAGSAAGNHPVYGG
jgi:hypothetical protein